jgi:hypothetical protein
LTNGFFERQIATLQKSGARLFDFGIGRDAAFFD